MLAVWRSFLLLYSDFSKVSLESLSSLWKSFLTLVNSAAWTSWNDFNCATSSSLFFRSFTTSTKSSNSSACSLLKWEKKEFRGLMESRKWIWNFIFRANRLYIGYRQGLLNYMDRTMRALAKFESSNWGLILGTQITPRGWSFWTIIFCNLLIQVKIYLIRGQTLFWVH